MTGGRLPRRTQEADDRSRQRRHLSDDVLADDVLADDVLADDVLADDVLEKLFHRYAERLFDELGHDLASGVVKPDCRHAGPRPQV
jgi:hypothetical protein